MTFSSSSPSTSHNARQDKVARDVGRAGAAGGRGGRERHGDVCVRADVPFIPVAGDMRDSVDDMCVYDLRAMGVSFPARIRLFVHYRVAVFLCAGGGLSQRDAR